MAWEEATITINGRLLTVGESMTLRVAMEAFASQLQPAESLGEDAMGGQLRLGYLRACDSIRDKLGYPR